MQVCFGVTFAAGSWLKRIEKSLCYDCQSLNEIEIPASVSITGGESVLRVGYRRLKLHCNVY